MINNPRIEFWYNLFNEMAHELGRKQATETLRTGKILLKDLGKDYVSFKCHTKEDKNCFTVNQTFSKAIGRIKPGFDRIELFARGVRKQTIHLH